MSRLRANVSSKELGRTPVSQRVGELSMASELFLSHFEHRVHLAVPDQWLPPDRPDLGGMLPWQAGVLPESKYHHFRLDSMVGSFHPGHRAAWTTHELCHRLVGFAFRPGSSPLYHALAARVAEVLPTATWYFFDEAHLRRCVAHAGRGPTFSVHCQACEEVALAGPWLEDPTAQRRLVEGRAFVARELEAITRSRTLGRCLPHAYATLDLASDGLAYAAAQRVRLESPEFRGFIERFFEGTSGTGRVESLDDLCQRVLDVQAALLDEAPLAPWLTRQEDYVAQDLAWRLCSVASESDEEANEGLRAIVDDLAEGGLPAAAFEAYQALHRDFILPSAEDVFAVGYAIPGVAGRSVRQILEGLESVLPSTLSLIADEAAETVEAFLEVDPTLRRPLARRFATYLTETRPGPVADLARYEAALAHPPPPDPESDTLGIRHALGGQRRRSTAFEVLHFTCDVVALASALDDAGELGGEAAEAALSTPSHLLIGRPAHGELVISDVTALTAHALLAMGDASVDPSTMGLSRGEIAALEAIGVLVPSAWRCE